MRQPDSGGSANADRIKRLVEAQLAVVKTAYGARVGRDAETALRLRLQQQLERAQAMRAVSLANADMPDWQFRADLGDHIVSPLRPGAAADGSASSQGGT